MHYFLKPSTLEHPISSNMCRTSAQMAATCPTTRRNAASKGLTGKVDKTAAGDDSGTDADDETSEHEDDDEDET